MHIRTSPGVGVDAVGLCTHEHTLTQISEHKCSSYKNQSCTATAYLESVAYCFQGRGATILKVGGQFCERSKQENFVDSPPPTFWPVGGQNIA